jgi:hypothetical protein
LGVYLFFLTSATKLHFFLGVFLHFIIGADTTRSVEITQEGLIFLNDAKNVLSIITLAKKRFEEPVVDERQFFSIECHSNNELRLFSGILRQMAEACPTLNPVFQVVPFQHLYQLLEE